MARRHRKFSGHDVGEIPFVVYADAVALGFLPETFSWWSLFRLWRLQRGGDHYRILLYLLQSRDVVVEALTIARHFEGKNLDLVVVAYGGAFAWRKAAAVLADILRMKFFSVSTRNPKARQEFFDLVNMSGFLIVSDSLRTELGADIRHDYMVSLQEARRGY